MATSSPKPGKQSKTYRQKRKRRTVEYITVKNPRTRRGHATDGSVTQKTITKRKRGGKVVTKTKSVQNPSEVRRLLGAKSKISKTKTVTTGKLPKSAGPIRSALSGTTKSTKNRQKTVSDSKAKRTTARLKKKTDKVYKKPKLVKKNKEIKEKITKKGKKKAIDKSFKRGAKSLNKAIKTIKRKEKRKTAAVQKTVRNK